MKTHLDRTLNLNQVRPPDCPQRDGGSVGPETAAALRRNNVNNLAAAETGAAVSSSVGINVGLSAAAAFKCLSSSERRHVLFTPADRKLPEQPRKTMWCSPKLHPDQDSMSHHAPWQHR